MKVANLTQHNATSDQLAAGVLDVSAELKRELSALLTFDEIPSSEEIVTRAEAVAEFCQRAFPGVNAAMIGGAPFFMAPLERALVKRGIAPLYAFSRRESVEAIGPDGKVTKTAVFRHVGFVKAVNSD